MPRPIHFEFCTEDLNRLTKFYREGLGWSFNSWGPDIPYRLATTGEDSSPGINGAAMQPFNGFSGVVLTMGTDDVPAAVKKAVEAGATIVKDTHPVHGIGWQAYLKDPDGNLFGLHASDTSAK